MDQWIGAFCGMPCNIQGFVLVFVTLTTQGFHRMIVAARQRMTAEQKIRDLTGTVNRNRYT